MKKSRKITIVIAIMLLLTILISNHFFHLQKQTKIDVILASENYSYLPVEAKDYIKVVYEETGEIILTEKNKEEDKPYLNPKFVAYLSLSEEEQEEVELLPNPYVVDFSSSTVVEDGVYPSKYNLTNVDNKNFTTLFKNQGNLGICWAFASIEQVESYLLLTNQKSYSSSSEIFSARQMDYAASSDGILDYENDSNRKLTTGGNFYTSSLIMSYGLSLVDDAKMPFNESISKKELSEVFNYKNSKYELESSITVPILSKNSTSSEKENHNQFVKENIMKYGGAYVGTGSPNGSCGFKNTDGTYAIVDEDDCSNTSAHAMQIIGWDDDYQYSYCKSGSTHSSVNSSGTCSNGSLVKGKGAWILRNSWGANSSYKYVYLVYDSYDLDINFSTSLSSMEDRTWDNTYYKNMWHNGWYFYTNTSDTVSYTKKIDTKEKIEKVKFNTFTSGGEYTLSIRVGNKTYNNIESFRVENPGIYTINVSDNNIILDDSNFDVTIRSTNDKKIVRNTISVFTSNVDSEPTIKTEDIEMVFDDGKDVIFKAYSSTKNIASGENALYYLYKEGVDYSNYISSYTNTSVAANNIYATITLKKGIPEGTYQLRTYYKGYYTDSTLTITYRLPLEGEGTKSNPYIIRTPEHLASIQDDLDAYYVLGNDIDLKEATKTGGNLSYPSNTCPQGFGWKSINGFSGSLDGNGHTIKGLYQNNYISCNINGTTWKEWNNNGNGLFGTTLGNASIRNLVLEDFDMACQGGNCGVLVSKFVNESSDNGYYATFENIVVRNSKIRGIYNGANSDSTLSSVYGGGLFGTLEVFDGKISISNIYLDLDIDTKEIKDAAYLASHIYGGDVDIHDIQLEGEFVGKYEDGNDDSLLLSKAYGNLNIYNILSTVITKNVGGLLGEVWTSNLSISSINMLKFPNSRLCYRDDESYCSNAKNVNMYDKDTQLEELLKEANYALWNDFNTNWIIKNVDGINRIPVLSFVDFKYTSIPEISLNHKLNTKVNVYEYITPKTNSARKIKYSSNDEDIVKIDSDGNIIPQSEGKTTIHIESYYDGYIKDVPITVSYIPHYNIIFDANGGTGTMDSVEVEVNKNYQLLKSTFTKENYVLKKWNTKADGTGESYQDLGQISALKDKETITLYAQWIGEEKVVIFNANGGIVTPDKKKIRYGDIYGELPMPTRDGYAFNGWSNKNAGTSIKYNSEFMGEEQIVAHWIGNAYNIIYDANGGILKSDYKMNNMVMSKTVLFDIAFNNSDTKISSNNYEKSGYIFKEWNTKADGTGTSYQENEVINFNNVEDSILKLYAQWERKEYTIRFDANGGIGLMKDNIGYLNNSIKILKNTFTRENYEFVGWNTKNDGTGISLGDETTVTIDENLFGKEYTITLYAQWKKEEVPFTIEKYHYDSEKKYISRIPINTSLRNFQDNIKLGNSYNIEVDTKEIDGKKVLFTGGKTKILKGRKLYEELINIVSGDVNGDGKINYLDYVTVYNHIQKVKYPDSSKKELINEYLISADISEDGKVNYLDYVQIYNKIKELKGGN